MQLIFSSLLTPQKLYKLDLLLVECSKISLKINIDKCSTMHLEGSSRECLPTLFSFNQILVKIVMKMDPIIFLGKPIGFQLINDHSQIEEFYEKAYKLLASFLIPWQKIDSLKSFLFITVICSENTHQISRRIGRGGDIYHKERYYLWPLVHLMSTYMEVWLIV